MHGIVIDLVRLWHHFAPTGGTPGMIAFKSFGLACGVTAAILSLIRAAGEFTRGSSSMGLLFLSLAPVAFILGELAAAVALRLAAWGFTLFLLSTG
jgi:hypothetical protein